MKNVLAYATLTITLATCATETTNKTWQSQLNENKKLAPQIVALLDVKELKENCTEGRYCSVFLEAVCRAIYNEEKVEKRQIDEAVEMIGRIYDWLPTKTKKVADQTWQSYLDFKAKNSTK